MHNCTLYLCYLEQTDTGVPQQNDSDPNSKCEFCTLRLRFTQENRGDLERTQKSFCKLILQDKYVNYENALLKLDLVSLEQRRQTLCLKFAKSGIKYEKMNDLFPTKNN